MPEIGVWNCRSHILDVRRDQQVLPGGRAVNARRVCACQGGKE
jgi:hypothetical protein